MTVQQLRKELDKLILQGKGAHCITIDNNLFDWYVFDIEDEKISTVDIYGIYTNNN